MIFATCATILAALASTSGEPIALSGDCPAVTITRAYAVRQTVIADGATVRGLTVNAGAGNLDWIGGTLRAPQGMTGVAANGYAAAIRGNDVSLIRVTFTDAVKALLLSGGNRNAVLFSSFTGIRDDGIYVNGAKAVRVIGNSFRDFRPLPTRCTIKSAVIEGLASRTCTEQGGVWKDGSHSDPVQMMNGADDGLYALNDADTAGQGIGQMDLTSDLPLNRVTIYRNKVVTGGFHSITTTRCNGCVIRENTVATSNTNKTSVRFAAPGTTACGNIAPVKSVAAEACK